MQNVTIWHSEYIITFSFLELFRTRRITPNIEMANSAEFHPDLRLCHKFSCFKIFNDILIF